MRAGSDVIARMLSRTFGAIEDVNRSPDRASLDRTVLRLAEPYGVSHFVVGVVPRAIPPLAERPGLILSGGFPELWAARYVRRQYMTEDPVIRHIVAQDVPLQWGGTDDRVSREAGDFGLKSGLATAQHSVEGHRFCHSFAGRELDDDPTARAALLFIGAAAGNRALALAAGPAPPISLTRRERDCLLWLIEGKTDWEIGMILSIGVKQVERHMANLRAKLNATSRTQAAVHAMRLGIAF